MDIVQLAETHVFGLFKDRLSPDYIYHNFNHTLRVVNGVRIIGGAEDLKNEEIETLILAALFHDIGYIQGPENHEQRSSMMARDFLLGNNYPEERADHVVKLIQVTAMGSEPETHSEKIMRDADCSHFAEKSYCALSELLREEWRLTMGKVFSDLEWALLNREMLIQHHRYYSEYAKKELQPRKEANIAALQAAINEMQPGETDSPKEKRKNKKEKTDRPDRGIDTMFRVTLNNHTRLSEIADSKANILLSVNAIIISIALTTLIPKLDSPSNAHLVIPTLILMIFSVVSVIFAILSTRPKVTSGTFTRKDIEDKKVNLLFFGNFYKVPLDEYEWAVNEMMKDRDYLYGSLIKDLYYLGLVLHRKYKLLRITYTIFMIGIIISVGSFIYAFKTM
jgi:predicted metal-dependent HD superfamily phosphohydrolase